MATNNILLHRQELTISQQIEELKNWHRQQQFKLISEKLPGQKDTFKETASRKSKDKNIPETKVHSNQNDNSSVQQNFDELPITVTNPNFIDILENNIPTNETGSSNPNDMLPKREVKPKFKFLKRGEGIARFRMGPQKIPKPKQQKTLTLNLHKDGEKLIDRDLDSGKQEDVLERKPISNTVNIETLEPPDVQLKFKDWRTILNSGKAEEIIDKAIDTDHLEIFQSNSSLDSSKASIMEKLIILGRKQIKENEELRVFEQLEQKMLDSSFCSTSSNIAKLMENAIMSTPEKKSFPKPSGLNSNIQTDKFCNVPSIDTKHKTDVQRTNEQKRPDPIWIGPENIKIINEQSLNESSTDSFEPSLHVRFSDKVDYKSFIENSQSPKTVDQKETYAVADFDESEEWKENSDDSSTTCCSHCSTSYSSSEDDVRAISPPCRPPSVNNIQKYPQCKQPNYCCNVQNGREIINSQKTIDDTNLAADNPKKTKQSTLENDVEQIEPILNAKVKELLNEIENFKAENKKLKELREMLERERKQFLQEKKKLLKEVEEEKKTNATFLENEKQKLAKEKMIFEKYSKSLTKNPTKEERKEILGLKEQLNEMKEELNKKESRWAAAQARVRNQVKILEEDNKKLKEEVQVLRKQSKHLEFLSRKKKEKPFNNTKLIHAISDHLSNIAIPDEEGKGYFNQKSTSYKIVECDTVDPKSINTVRVIRESGTKHSSKTVQNKCKELIELPQKQIVPSEISRSEVNSVSVQEKASSRPEAHSNLSLENATLKVTSVEGGVTDSVKETINQDGSVQKVYPDGRKEMVFKNGNIKKTDPLTGNEKTIYFNGDVEEVLRDGTVKYYFSESRRWQTIFPDGLEVWDFPNGQVEKNHTNGMVEVIFPNDVRKITYPDGSEEIFYADGTTLKTDANKRKVLCLPNGQKEIHTDECVRREYPDGTVKKLYPDGTTETVYSNGRVRVKDKHGNLVMDSGSFSDKEL
ncbi:centromere protein J isoform X1 [Homalodisca vitripennis]|uniref:centromere protein J isoform X1 n=1 Tax=Homalodisca vitripennis TaxID=197043 RepID=UPI001EEA0B01|nr:centromere protein J isoform X1 [Homalodisca vitripennis]